MKKRIFASLAFLVLSSAATAARADPSRMLQGLWKDVRGALVSGDAAAKEEAIGSLLKANYDFRSFYETALQDHWSGWSDAQKADFDARFEKLFLASLARKIGRLPASGGELAAVQVRISGDRAEGQFLAKKGTKQASFHVFFSKTENPSGDEWKIYDVEIEGILVSRNYRAQFNRIIRSEEYSGLMARLDQKIIAQGGAL